MSDDNDPPTEKPPKGRPLEADDLEHLGTHPGLCATCHHARVLASKRSVFLFCGLSAVDERFPRYPRLPVLGCGGWVRKGGVSGGG